MVFVCEVVKHFTSVFVAYRVWRIPPAEAGGGTVHLIRSCFPNAV